MNTYKQTFLSIICATMFFTTCNGQGKTISICQPKLVKTQFSNQEGNNVHCSLQDKKGNIWFATTSNGVYRYDGKSFINFTTTDGLNSNAVFAMLQDKVGNIWFGTDKGLSLFDGTSFKLISISNEIYLDPFCEKQTKNYAVDCMLEAKNGKIWFGTSNGVYCYDGKIFNCFLDNLNVVNSNKLTLQLVTNMLEDKQGDIWFATRTEGVCRYDGKSLTNYKPDNQEWFRGLLEDKNGNIWLGTRYKGVYRFDGKVFAKILLDSQFDTYTVISIIQDKKENIWFASEGVWRYDGKTIQNISKKDDLSNLAVWCILEDKSGNFWIGTRNTDLYRYDGKFFTIFSE